MQRNNLTGCYDCALLMQYNRVLLNRIVRLAGKIIGMTLPTVDELYETCVMKKTIHTLKDTSHQLHGYYYVAQSGCRSVSERTHPNH